MQCESVSRDACCQPWLTEDPCCFTSPVGFTEIIWLNKCNGDFLGFLSCNFWFACHVALNLPFWTFFRGKLTESNDCEWSIVPSLHELGLFFVNGLPSFHEKNDCCSLDGICKTESERRERESVKRISLYVQVSYPTNGKEDKIKLRLRRLRIT